jgi:hypothetical protein
MTRLLLLIGALALTVLSPVIGVAVKSESPSQPATIDIPGDGVMIATPPHPPTVVATIPPGMSVEGIGITEKQVNISNFYPGAEADYYIEVLNRAQYERRVEVEYQTADPDGDYVPAPLVAKGWVHISQTRTIVPALSVIRIPVTVELPKDAKVSPKWKFYIAVYEAPLNVRGASIQSGVKQAWFIDMR